jgi:hypothetical protein
LHIAGVSAARADGATGKHFVEKLSVESGWGTRFRRVPAEDERVRYMPNKALRPRPQVMVLTGRGLRHAARHGTPTAKANLALALHTGSARIQQLRPADAMRLAGASYAQYYKARRQRMGAANASAD